jgi:hypothetical protein
MEHIVDKMWNHNILRLGILPLEKTSAARNEEIYRENFITI